MTKISDKYIARPIPLNGNIASNHRAFVNRGAYELTPSAFVLSQMQFINRGFDISVDNTLKRYENAMGRLFRADVTLHPDFAYTYFVMKGDVINNMYAKLVLIDLEEDIAAYLKVIHNQTIGLS